MNGKKILVVDDELHITQILSYKLKQSGAAVITANDGAEGYKLACEHLPDLILTDFQMPAMNGYELATQLAVNAATSSIPLLMLTARGHKLSPEELARTNITGLVPKPFSAREVLSRVQDLIAASTHLKDDQGGQRPGAAVA